MTNHYILYKNPSLIHHIKNYYKVGFILDLYNMSKVITMQSFI